MTKVAYASTATWGGGDGRARTADGSIEVALATPKELGGTGKVNNPEQLFAAGYAACFLDAMNFVGSLGRHAKPPADGTVTATVGIGPRQDTGFAALRLLSKSACRVWSLRKPTR
jgi:Ohr subfamily peroxiredoxin